MGIDISHYNKVIDWESANLGLEWCACKVTQGTGYRDPTFAQNRASAIARHFLAYHWISFNWPIEDQIKNIRLTVGTLAEGEGIMLDVEEHGVTELDVFTAATMIHNLFGRPPTIYVGVYFDGGRVWRSQRLRDIGCPFVLACYTAEDRARRLAAPYWCDAWQWTSSGTWPGIVGRVDLDRVDNPIAFDICCYDSSIQIPVPLPAPVEPEPWPTNDPANGQMGLYPFGPKPLISMARRAKNNAGVVKYLQACIYRGTGIGVHVDGDFGPETDSGVKQVQRFFGVWIDGVVGPQTWGIVDAFLFPKATA